MVVSVRNVLSHIKLHLVPCDSYAHIWTWIRYIYAHTCTQMYCMYMYCRNLLLRVLSTLTVIGYKMVELLSTIVSHFKLAGKLRTLFYVHWIY